MADLNGIPVHNGQWVYLIESSGTSWALEKGRILYLKDDSFVLTATGTDDSGNSASDSAEPDFRSRGHYWHWR